MAGTYEVKLGDYKISAPLSSDAENVINSIQKITQAGQQLGQKIAGVFGAAGQATQGLVIQPQVTVQQANVQVPFLELLKRNAPYITIAVVLVIILVLVASK